MVLTWLACASSPLNVVPVIRGDLARVDVARHEVIAAVVVTASAPLPRPQLYATRRRLTSPTIATR